MHTKNFILTGTLALLALFLILFFVYSMTPSSGDATKNESEENTAFENNTNDTLPGNEDSESSGRHTDTPQSSETPSGKIKANVFTGTLEKVDTGCFADGECYVEVDGTHVTAIMGWSRETVGSIQGVEGFGDLESFIGKKVEVYAQEKTDGSYTLYGSEGFYIKLLSGSEVRNNPPAQSVVANGCVIGGCSSQLCLDASTGGDMASTCEYRQEYACYKTAQCERQTTGKCGWTESDDLKACIQNGGLETM